jgi:hypothetical protein
LNAHLSPAGSLVINGVSTPVKDYRAFMKRVFTNSLNVGERPPLYMLGTPSAVQYLAGIRQLTSLEISFPTTAILGSGLIGITPQCSRKNEMGLGGEYRNGALTVQILDASDATYDDYEYDDDTETYYKPGGSHRVHQLGYAVPYDLGDHEVGDGMMYEMMTYWHWDGGCYSPDREDEYIEEYEDIIGSPFVQRTDDDIAAHPADDDEGDGDGSGGEGGAVSDAEEFHEVTTTVVSSSDRIGRLFWHEIIPDE